MFFCRLLWEYLQNSGGSTSYVSKKVFSHRQNKLVKIKLGLQCISCFCARRCSPPEFVSAPDDL